MSVQERYYAPEALQRLPVVKREPVRNGLLSKVKNSLADFSVEALKESERLAQLTREERVDEILQNLRGYENEVLKDSLVSVAYSYWFDADGTPYTNPAKKDIHRFTDQFDPQERGEAPRQGFEKVTHLIRQNPGEVVLWYSPKGRATFDHNPNNPYKDIKFIYGQLYLQYYDEHEDKARAVAIKVTDESIFEELMPATFQGAEQQPDAEQRINSYLANPLRTGLTIDDFLGMDWTIGTVYKDKAGVEHDFDEVLAMVRDKFINNSDTVSYNARRFARQLAYSEGREEDILRGYLEFVHAHQQTTGLSVIDLMGACGGRKVTASELEALLGISRSSSNIYSAGFRSNSALREEKKKDHRDDPRLCRCDAASGPHFHCPGKKSKSGQKNKQEDCRHPIVVGKGITQCPSCGQGKTC